MKIPIIPTIVAISLAIGCTFSFIKQHNKAHKKALQYQQEKDNALISKGKNSYKFE